MSKNRKSILIINPNSSHFVTESIRETVAPVQESVPHRIECIGLRDGPAGIDTQADIERAIPLIEACIQTMDHDAYVLACFSDPGIRELRAKCGKPIFGIGECGYLQAMSMGERFGVISTVSEAAERHVRYISSLGFIKRLAADLPLDLRVTGLSDEKDAYQRIVSVADSLVESGADVLILGCAGMGRYQLKLRDTMGIPVIEPVIATVQFALGSFQFVRPL